MGRALGTGMLHRFDSRRARHLGFLAGLATCAYMAGCADEVPATEAAAESGILSVGESTDDGTVADESSSSEGTTLELGESGECADVHVTVAPVVPTLVLLIDQSGSMTEDFGELERWDAVYRTLM